MGGVTASAHLNCSRQGEGREMGGVTACGRDGLGGGVGGAPPESDGGADSPGRQHLGRPQVAAWIPSERRTGGSLLLSKGQGQFVQFTWLKIEKKK
jgi:hypothetical protein